MAKLNTNKLEKDIAKKEEEILQEFKEELLAMDKEEFTEYFKQLIKKYYDILFTFEHDYSKYYEDSNKQYDSTIKLVKDLLSYKYNNLDNFENLERLKQAESIAFNQMNTIQSLESNYSDLVYYNASMELNYINETLSSLIELYRKEPSEDLLEIIERRLYSSLHMIKQAKKLPVYEGYASDYIKTFTVKKEHFKTTERPEEDVEEVAITVPLLSFYIPQLLEKFFKLLEELETILPEDVITSFYIDLDSSEMVEHYNNLKASGMEEEEAKELTAYLGYIKKKNYQGFLYEILDSWS